MGYTLIAKKKELKEFNLGAFSWPQYLSESGMGYVLGYGNSMKPATYSYQTGNNGSPVSNDGYKVSAKEAKAMALVGRGYISVQRFANSEWEKLSPEQLVSFEKMAEEYPRVWRGKMHEDHLKKIEELAEWFEKSGGFTIN